MGYYNAIGEFIGVPSPLPELYEQVIFDRFEMP